jgi:hypothetical protein
MSTCTRPNPSDHDEAGRDIENTLRSIKSIAAVIDGLNDAELEPGALSYLADRLVEHYDEIYDAWRRIFGFDQYAEKGPGESRTGASIPAERGIDPLQPSVDLLLFALIEEYRRRHQKANETGVNEVSDEEVDRLSDELRTVRDHLDKVRPLTLSGVLAVFNLGELINDPDWWPDEAIEGLREIAEKGGSA